MDSERVKDLERQVAYLIQRACANGHDWGGTNRISNGHGGWVDLRNCRCCGKGDLRPVAKVARKQDKHASPVTKLTGSFQFGKEGDSDRAVA